MTPKIANISVRCTFGAVYDRLEREREKEEMRSGKGRLTSQGLLCHFFLTLAFLRSFSNPALMAKSYLYDVSQTFNVGNVLGREAPPNMQMR